jgi:hypothetical protein
LETLTLKKELLLRMKKCELIYDTKLGEFFNKNCDPDKRAVLDILDLLYENFDKVKFTRDLSPSVIGKKSWGVMVSEKLAMMDKIIPLPQVPFHIIVEGKNFRVHSPCEAYFVLKEFLENEDESIYVFLNFKQKELKRMFDSSLV